MTPVAPETPFRARGPHNEQPVCGATARPGGSAVRVPARFWLRPGPHWAGPGLTAAPLRGPRTAHVASPSRLRPEPRAARRDPPGDSHVRLVQAGSPGSGGPTALRARLRPCGGVGGRRHGRRRRPGRPQVQTCTRSPRVTDGLDELQPVKSPAGQAECRVLGPPPPSGSGCPRRGPGLRMAGKPPGRHSQAPSGVTGGEDAEAAPGNRPDPATSRKRWAGATCHSSASAALEGHPPEYRELQTRTFDLQ